MKKKGFTLVEMIAVVIIIAIIAVLAVPPVLQSIRGAKDEISDAMKKVIISASDIYMDADKDNYVRYNGNRYCITIKQLVEDERLNNPVYDPTTSKEISQDKFVQVDIFDNEYSYEIVDTCEEIRKHSLIYQLKQQYKEGNTSGLLKDDDGSYYYKGTNEEVSNNFVWFGGHLWRVISINNDDTLTMITQQSITALRPSSDIWDTKEKYEESFINTWLNETFLSGIESSDMLKIQDSIFNIGVFGNINEIQTIQKIGLLNTDQYVKAGERDSFLDIKSNFWLGNRRSTSGDGMSIANESGYLDRNALNLAFGVRPVIKISDIVVNDGNGELINPYRQINITKTINKIKVGEYISVPTEGTDCGEDNRCLFRVVSKDDDSIKVILNGILPNETEFGSGLYAKGNAIDTILVTFSNTINSKYLYIKNKQFNIGPYSTSNTSLYDYRNLNSRIYEGYVGLPVIGEMFSGNDINISDQGLYINIKTVENFSAMKAYWTMNGNGDMSHIWINNKSGLSETWNTGSFGVRPVLFLKNNLKFTGGEGTAENPFTLE